MFNTAVASNAEQGVVLEWDSYNLFSLSPMYTCDGRPLECCLDNSMAHERQTDIEKMTQEQLEVSII